jgi:hypothetical protein
MSGFAVIDPWTWGGDSTFEILFRFDKFHRQSRIFDLGNGPFEDNFILGNWETTELLLAGACHFF